MPFYYTINSRYAHGARTAQRLMDIQDALKDGAGDPEERNYIAPVPQRTLNDTLLLASWNIREFDSSRYGKRSRESLFYIAEIISHFDLVAVQEIREDLTALDQLRRILGNRTWDYLVTDVTEGRGGNSERMAFIYDRRKVQPTGLVGEIVLPPVKGQPVRQFARSPFLVGFQAGWFKFSLCTVHIYYGGDEANQKERIEEIDSLAKFLSKRIKRYRKKYRQEGKKHSEYENIALLGDFNIFTTEDETFKALKKHKFLVPDGLYGKATNTGKKSRAFDQIAFLEDEDNVQYTNNSGVIDFFRVVYRDEDRNCYTQQMANTIKKSNERKSAAKKSLAYGSRTSKKKTSYYKAWRTFQMSDHLPLWVELKINFSREYLERKAEGDEE